MGESGTDKSGPQTEHAPQTERAIGFISGGIVAGFLWCILYALQGSGPWQVVSILGVVALVASAALFIGALLGFIFGIPRTLQGDNAPKPADDQVKGQRLDAKLDVKYQANTNLEQISDWLTKILVGVGLTQISSIPEAIQKYTAYVSPGLGGFQTTSVFAASLPLYFLVCGFLLSYLWTRRYLAGELREADLGALGGKLAEVESKLGELEKQAQLDAKATLVVQRLLNPGPDTPAPQQEEINSAIRASSQVTKASIFYQAQRVRRENWRERHTKATMERTIPIFRALIASDTDDSYHPNHGQLGFALKDQRKPDWREAEAELTKAIELRGDWREHNWVLYEFNRAVCRIHLDEAFQHKKRADTTTNAAIQADVAVASHAEELDKLIQSEPIFVDWIKLNA